MTSGDLVSAGSFNAGRAAFAVVARTGFDESPLIPLLRQARPTPEPSPSRTGGARHLRFWDRLARRWVVTVLATAAAGLVLWLPRGAGQALDVAAALLVVTCPCGIGIALPLAYDITQARLRRSGFFART